MIIFETALSTALVLVSSFGLGAWIPINSISGKIMIGAILIPICLITLHITTEQKLTHISIIIVILSIIGVIKFFFYKKELTSFIELLNPVLVLPIIFLMLLISTNDITYQIFEWDEFASWMYWTKEAYLADSLLPMDIGWRGLKYPQGWPIALVYPQLFFSTFDPLRSIVVNLVWNAATLGLIYDLIFNYLRKIKWGSNILIITTCYVVVLIILTAEITGTLVPKSFLVEMPQVYITISIFSLLCFRVFNYENHAGIVFSIGLLLAAGFLIKLSMVTVIPAVLITVLYGDYTGHKKNNIKRTTISMLSNTLLITIPSLIVIIIWSQLPETKTVGLNSLSFSLDFQKTHLDLLVRLIEGTYSYLSLWKAPVTTLAILGLICAVADTSLRTVILGLIIFYLAYAFGLFQLYAFRFAGYEATHLASLQRYLRLPISLMHFLGITFLIITLCRTFIRINFSIRGFFTKEYLAYPILSLLILFFSYQVMNIKDTFSEITNRSEMSSARVAIIKKLQKDQKNIIQLIDGLDNKNRRKLPAIAFIHQGDDGYSYRVVSFLALKDTRRNGRLAYKLLPGYSWGDLNLTNIWMRKISPSKLVARLKKADLIWSLRRDAWINKALMPLTKDCSIGNSWTYLVKINYISNKFRCLSRSAN